MTAVGNVPSIRYIILCLCLFFAGPSAGKASVKFRASEVQCSAVNVKLSGSDRLLFTFEAEVFCHMQESFPKGVPDLKENFVSYWQESDRYQVSDLDKDAVHGDVRGWTLNLLDSYSSTYGKIKIYSDVFLYQPTPLSLHFESKSKKIEGDTDSVRSTKTEENIVSVEISSAVFRNTDSGDENINTVTLTMKRIIIVKKPVFAPRELFLGMVQKGLKKALNETAPSYLSGCISGLRKDGSRMELPASEKISGFP